MVLTEMFPSLKDKHNKYDYCVCEECQKGGFSIEIIQKYCLDKESVKEVLKKYTGPNNELTMQHIKVELGLDETDTRSK